MKDSKEKMMETEREHGRMKEIYREIMETERNNGEMEGKWGRRRRENKENQQLREHGATGFPVWA